MDSKERVRRTILKQNPDRLAANFSSTDYVKQKLMKHYGFSDFEQVLQKLQIDIRDVEPIYCGEKLAEGQNVWGCITENYWTGTEWYQHVKHSPLEGCETVEDLKKCRWPNADDYDYEYIKRFCDQHPTQAISIGWVGVWQICCDLRGTEQLYMDMAGDPDMAHFIFDKMCEFELEYYERMLIAGDGQVDILRACDDYGTQLGLIFGVPMWKEYHQKNLKKLVDLAHRYNAFYMQHSCGAIRDIIPELVNCGIDILDPLQKLPGMEPQSLKADFGDKLCFQGGIDTQELLPHGTPSQVAEETKSVVEALYDNGGYILKASQGLQRDVPIENIEAMYFACR